MEMYDGPAKSLPLQSEWKKVAKRLEGDAWEIQDVFVVVLSALSKNFRRKGLRKLFANIKNIVCNGPSVSSHDRTDRLELLRIEIGGSSLENLLLDYTVHALEIGRTGYDAIETAIGKTSHDLALNHLSQIQQHYLARFDRQKMSFMNKRIAELRNEIEYATFNRFIDTLETGLGAIKPAKYTDLDQGVPIE